MDLGSQDPSGRPAMFPWRWVWLALTVAVLAGVIVGWLLWGTTTADHKDAFDTGWKSSAAVLAILATFISVDRFRLSQREHHRQLVVDHFTRRDLVARQITDLSAKASEQLGSDKAAVRIGGLTDLERLAQSHPELRQTVVDRICAYLRAPYRPPPDRDFPDPDPLGPEEVAAARLELDVRRTAQLILARHLRWPADVAERPASFWADISLNLRDATLVELTLEHCRLGTADFRNAQFHVFADFRGATFEQAWFHQATFTGNAEFGGAAFTEGAVFLETTFEAAALFERAAFAHAGFTKAIFTGIASFAEATFTGHAYFSGTTFADSAHFDLAAFRADANFGHAAFRGTAVFPGAIFTGKAEFDGATFGGRTWFGEGADHKGDGYDSAAVTGPVWHTYVRTSDVHIPAARFDGAVSFKGARVTDPRQAHFWPPPWRAKPDPDEPGGPYVLRARRER